MKIFGYTKAATASQPTLLVTHSNHEQRSAYGKLILSMRHISSLYCVLISFQNDDLYFY